MELVLFEHNVIQVRHSHHQHCDVVIIHTYIHTFIHTYIHTYIQLAPSSFRNTLKLLPVGKKGKQKFVYGDDNGCVSCYEIKRGEAQVSPDNDDDY